MSSLSKRITSGIIFFIVVAGALLCKCTFLPLLVIIGAIMMGEYYSMTLSKRFFREQVFMISAVVFALVLLFLTLSRDLATNTYYSNLIPILATCI